MRRRAERTYMPEHRKVGPRLGTLPHLVPRRTRNRGRSVRQSDHWSLDIATYQRSLFVSCSLNDGAGSLLLNHPGNARPGVLKLLALSACVVRAEAAGKWIVVQVMAEECLAVAGIKRC